MPVPPAYPAWDSRNSECAALIEWFYGKPGDDWQGYLPGGWFMKASIKDYDFKRGTQHNFGTIEGWCMLLSVTRLLSKNRVGLNTDWEMGWARVLTFDALIGNTDRHHENWGFLMTRTGNPPEIRLQLAPAFDNGTSLGHERPESQFQRFEQARYLQGYIRKGHHHMRLHQHDPKQAGFAELLLNLVKKYPQSQSAIDAVLHFDTGKLTAAVMELTQLELPVPLSEARARFMLRLVLARRDALLEALS